MYSLPKDAPFVSLDWETYYDNKVGATIQGSWGYHRDPRAYAYLIALAWGPEKEHSITCHPSEFDFASLEGKIVLSHNRSFDEERYLAGVEQGLWPLVKVKEWHCTADLSAYLWNRRSLMDAVFHAYGVSLSKDVRANMKGKHVEDLTPDERKALYDYGYSDAVWCWKLWNDFGSQWPKHEREYSDLNIRQGRYGVAIHRERLDAAIQLMETVITTAESRMPWVARGRKPGSPIGIAEQCREDGIPSPPVKKHEPEEHSEWLLKYEDTIPWVKSIADVRRAKKALASLETIRERIREDGTFPFSCYYFGAHTGRVSGTGGFNMQNLNRDPIFVTPDLHILADPKKVEAAADHLKKTGEWIGRYVDMRGLFVARDGKALFTPDLSQIEPRCLHWAAGNEGFLAAVRAGMAVYEAFARTNLGWDKGPLKKEAPKLYSLAKAQVLGLGYLMGWEKFIDAAWALARVDVTEDDEKVALEESVDGKIYTTEPDPAHKDFGRPVEPFYVGRYYDFEEKKEILVRFPVYGANARKIVRNFRNTEDGKRIRAFGKALEAAFKDSVGGDFTVELPSGRTLTYRNVIRSAKQKQDPYTGKIRTVEYLTCEIGTDRTVMHAGIFLENFTQAFARDVFMLGVMRIERAFSDYRWDLEWWQNLHAKPATLWTVHDEAIAEADTSLDKDTFETLLGQAPDWAPGLPVASEAHKTDRYMK